MSWHIVSGDSVVLSSSVSSRWRRSAITSIASAIGTFVNRLTTSKLTSLSSSSNVVSHIRLAKSAESFTKEEVWPARGESIVAISLESLYVGESIAETMGLRGVPAL